MLASLSYLQGYEPGPDVAGVVSYDSGLSCNGVNLVVSGHAPEAVIMDMEGKLLHTWSLQFDQIWEDGPPSHLPEDPVGRAYWRRAELLDDGSLLAIFEGQCLIKIDKDSRLVWNYPHRAHHDVYVDEGGTIWTITREARIHPVLNQNQPIVEDFVVALSPTGEEVDCFSVVDCFLDSDRMPAFDKPPHGDFFHTNSLKVLDGTSGNAFPAFEAGNLLLSVRELDTICVVDPDERRLCWASRGPWDAQHDPRLLNTGNILLFDNIGNNGSSRVIEFNPVTERIEWVFPATSDRTLLSRTCGTSRRLANGNTLITETDAGRALEVTRDGRVVWEYVNPHRTGENREFIATLLDVIRLPEIPPWLDG